MRYIFTMAERDKDGEEKGGPSELFSMNVARSDDNGAIDIAVEYIRAFLYRVAWFCVYVEAEGDGNRRGVATLYWCDDRTAELKIEDGDERFDIDVAQKYDRPFQARDERT